MAIRITGRQVAVTKQIRDYIEKKLPRLEKYAERIHSIEVVLEKDRYDHRVEVKIKDGPVSVNAKAKDPDPLRAIDLIIEKLERQMQKKWEKMRGQKKRKGMSPKKAAATVASDPDAFPLEEEEHGGYWPEEKVRASKTRAAVKRSAAADADRKRRVPVFVEKLGVRIFRAEPENLDVMTLEGAAEELFFKDENFLCFTNPETGKLTLIYRRKDGNFGFFEPNTE